MGLENSGLRMWWISPTNQGSFLAWEKIKEYVGRVAQIEETRKRLIFPTGSEIWCKSADKPDYLRGDGISFVVIDEAAHIRDLRYVWAGVLRPMLIDTGGSMLALSTPKRRNMFHQWFLRGQDSLAPAWQAWNFPTTENPYLPQSEFEDLLQDYPPGSELYRQEILGEFLESVGAVFRKVREAATAPAGAKPEGDALYYGGIDWGKSQDFTAVAVMDAEGRMVALDRFNAVDYAVQRDRIKALHQRWRVANWQVELNSMGQPNYEMLLRDGLPVTGFTTTAQSKRPLIEGLAQAFELGRIEILDDPVLVGELEAYERKESRNTGASTYSAPQGMHDDTVIATALAWRATQHSGAIVSFA